MLDGLLKSKIDRFWNMPGRILARTGITPNGVTLLGLGLTLAACALFVWSGHYLFFGLFLGLSFACDSLDGAVARVTGRSTKFGSFLDAVIDRYQEMAVCFVIGVESGFWIPVYLVMSGSFLVSYNKARTAVDMTISNDAWPDLLERTERVLLLCLILVLEGVFPGRGILYYLLVLLGIGTHVTAVQRFFRARKLLTREDRKTRP